MDRRGISRLGCIVIEREKSHAFLESVNSWRESDTVCHRDLCRKRGKTREMLFNRVARELFKAYS